MRKSTVALILLSIFAMTMRSIADEPAISFYVFTKNDFVNHVSKGRQFSDLAQADITSNATFIRFQGIFKSVPTDVRLYDGVTNYFLELDQPRLFGSKEKNVLEYRFFLSSKTLDTTIDIKGKVEMQGLKKLSIDKNWNKSRFVVIFFSENLKK